MISTNLQILRKINKYTQEEVAEKINVSRQAVAKWESGDSLPDINNCMALARLYDVTLDNLVHRAEAGAVPIIPPKGKHIFGTVTVGERGQIVIPKKARDVFHIKSGDSLIILGDEAQGGIAALKTEHFMQIIETFTDAIRKPNDIGPEGKTNND
jgi:AbrB family looped-hinge helix DNA binding protein